MHLKPRVQSLNQSYKLGVSHLFIAKAHLIAEAYFGNVAINWRKLLDLHAKHYLGASHFKLARHEFRTVARKNVGSVRLHLAHRLQEAVQWKILVLSLQLQELVLVVGQLQTKLSMLDKVVVFGDFF